HREKLYNNGNADVQDAQVYLVGADASEFSIVANQFGYPDLTQRFIMKMGDSMWVDVKFTPDLNKKYALRHAQLIATWFDKGESKLDSTFLDLYAKVLHADLSFNPTTVSLGFVPFGTPTTGFVDVTNNGDAPFIVSQIVFPNPPIVGVRLNGNP